MTIASQVNKSGPYAGNGSQTEFPFDWLALDEAHVKVYKHDTLTGTTTLLTLTTHYTVDGVGDDSGGTVAMVSAPLSTDTITIAREVPLVQEMDLSNQGAWLPENHEVAFDKLTMITQQLQEQLNRAVTVDITSDDDPNEVMNSVYLYADAAGESAGDAADSAAAALASQNAAAASESDAEAAASTATSARDTAVSAKDTAVVASGTAVSAKDTAVAAAGTATSKASEASGYKDTAVSAAGTATTKASEASDSALAASGSASSASGSASTATTKASEASDSATLAGYYAERAEDSQIPGHTGEYSAKHWAAKAAAAASGGAAKVSSDDTTPGYLDSKLTLAGSSALTKTVTSPAADEKLQLDVSTATGATSGAAGTKGVTPAPAAGDQDKLLNGAMQYINLLKSMLLQGYAEKEVDSGSVSNGATVTLDLSAGSIFKMAPASGAAFTIAISNAPASGYGTGIVLRLANAGTAPTITYPTGSKYAGNVKPTLTASGLDIVVGQYVGGEWVWGSSVKDARNS